jgi:hypothetical protein
MSDVVPPPSWSLLPTLVLEKIFDHVPRLLLPTMARVCTGWRYAIHRLAVKYLDVCIQTKRIEEQQLERWGWSSSTLWDHNVSTCSCIHLAFDFFTGQQEKPEFVAGTSKPLFDESLCRYINYPPCILGEKLFFEALDEEGWALKVMNRLEPENEPRVLQEEITGVWDVKMVSCGDLLAILLLGKQIVSLWNGRDERWLADVDVASNLQLNRFDLIDIADIGVSSNLMALSVGTKKLRNCLRFWRLETDQQAGMTPYFIGMVQIRDRSLKNIQINEKWVVIWLGDDLHYIDQSDLFTEDKSQIAASANVANSEETGNKWRQIGLENGRGKGQLWYLRLQPGHSSHVAVELDYRYNDNMNCSGVSTVVFRNRINNTNRTGKKMSSW